MNQYFYPSVCLIHQRALQNPAVLLPVSEGAVCHSGAASGMMQNARSRWIRTHCSGVQS